MVEQKDVLLKLEEAGKVGLKAALMELIKPEGALALELQIAAQQNESVKIIVDAAMPFLLKAAKDLAEKL